MCSIQIAERVQRCWRGHVARRHCAELRRVNAQRLLEQRAAVCCQCYARGVTVRRFFRRLHCAASLIQAIWRGRCARLSARSLKLDKYNEMLQGQHTAAIILQRVYRGRDCRARLRVEQYAAIALQSLCRSWLQHLTLYTHVWDVCAVAIQTRWRGVQTRKRVIGAMRAEIKALEAVALLQALALAKAARDQWARMLAQFELEVAMATKLQKVRVQAWCAFVRVCTKH